MTPDILALLQDWPYDENNNVRKVVDKDGREKIQVRVQEGPFGGLLQMELEGRPDGTRPHGRAFALEYWEEELHRYSDQHGGGEGFQLQHEACQELFDEGQCLYQRYVFLLRLTEFRRVVRDTERNMRLFRFVNRYATAGEDRNNLERWWPYVLRINATARAMLALRAEDLTDATEIVRQAREKILRLPDQDVEEFAVERDRSLEALDELLEQLDKERPRSVAETLAERLQRAVAAEDYERAAQLRDELHRLQQNT